MCLFSVTLSSVLCELSELCSLQCQLWVATFSFSNSNGNLVLSI